MFNVFFVFIKKNNKPLSSGTDAWHGPRHYTSQRTSWRCATTKQNNVQIPSVVRMGNKDTHRDAGSNVPQCDTASVGWSAHYIRPSADVETSRGACWVKGLLECWGNTENHKQELISDSCTIFLSSVLSNLKCQTCSLYKRAVYSKM